jgi:hypothetical protein
MSSRTQHLGVYLAQLPVEVLRLAKRRNMVRVPALDPYLGRSRHLLRRGLSSWQTLAIRLTHLLRIR